MTYQLLSQEENRNKFASLTNEGVRTDVVFTTRVSQVPVAGNLKVPVVTETVSLARQKDVSCPDDACAKSYIGESCKIVLSGERGDTTELTALIDEAIRLLGIWRSSYNGDHGMLPPGNATFPVVP